MGDGTEPTGENELERVREALGWFVADSRFDVAVGGNPELVERMISEALARYVGDR